MSPQPRNANSLTTKLILLTIFGIASIFHVVGAAQEDSLRHAAQLPESWARQAALTTVMPTYPEEAVSRGVSGVVQVKFATSPEGEVVRIKVKPKTEPLLATAVAAALKQWTFKTKHGQDGSLQPVISRLSFRFVFSTQPTVELDDPGLRPPDVQSLGYYNSAKEMREWKEWQEVFPEPSKP